MKQPMTKPRQRLKNFRMPDEVWQALEERALQERRTETAVMRLALENYLQTVAGKGHVDPPEPPVPAVVRYNPPNEDGVVMEFTDSRGRRIVHKQFPASMNGHSKPISALKHQKVKANGDSGHNPPLSDESEV